MFCGGMELRLHLKLFKDNTTFRECVWNLRVFQRCTGASVLLPVVPSSTGLPSKRCLGIGFSSSADQEIGVFQHVAAPTRLHLEFPREIGLILRRAGKSGNPFQTKQGNRPSFRDQEERKGSDEVVPEPRCSP